MGGRSGQSIGNKGKTTGKEKLQQLQQKVKELERRQREVNEGLKNASITDDNSFQEYLKLGAEKQKIDQALENAKQELDNEQQKTKGTAGNEFTINDIQNGKLTSKLNPNPQTDYKISQSDLDKLSDKNAQPDYVDGNQKSKYWFTEDSWQNSDKTNKAFSDMGLPKTPENMAVLYYTADSKVNSGYYDGQTPTEQDKIYKDILNNSLDKYGNKYDGTTYRGVRGDYANNLYNQVKNAGIGSDITFDGFQSSSYKEDAAFSGGVMIVAKSKQGHMLDNFTHYQNTEAEVLYKAGSKFKITGFEEKNGKKYIYLED